MANNQITFGVGFKVDKTGLNELKKSLDEISKITTSDFMKNNPGVNFSQAQKELLNIKDTASDVQQALNKAFNPKLGMVNIQAFNKYLQQTGHTINSVNASFSRIGAVGQSAFRQLAMETTGVNLQLKSTTGILDRMAETLGNTIKWNLASGAINLLSGSIQQAFGFVKGLDSSLNDIRIVTGASAEQMKSFAEAANTAAKSLGQSTRNYTDAALIYYQQGKGDAEAQRLAEITLKAANVTGQSGAEVSEQLTAIWNGYKVSAAEAELYIDKVAAVAADTAADLEELATGMSKVASAANTMGVDIDQLNAQLATIVSVTRQAPESVGTALKTIYARMTDLKIGGTDEDGLNLGKVSGGLADLGINILDAEGHLRDIGDVIEEVGGKWENWTTEQQAAIAQLMAGTRQYNNLMALFDNWDMYEDALYTSANAMGTLNEQQATYMESTKAHLQGVSTAAEDLYKSLLDTNTINGVADVFKELIELTTIWVDSLGGGLGVLSNLGAIATTVFSKQIAGGINNFLTNRERGKSNQRQIDDALQQIEKYKKQEGLDASTRELLSQRENLFNLSRYMKPDDVNKISKDIESMVPDLDQLKDLEKFKKTYEDFIKKAKQAKNIKILDNGTQLNVIGEQLKKVTNDFNGLQQKFKEGLDKNNFVNLSKTVTDLQEKLKALQGMGLIKEKDPQFTQLTRDLEKYSKLLKAYNEGEFKDDSKLKNLGSVIAGRLAGIGLPLNQMSSQIIQEINSIFDDSAMTIDQKIQAIQEKLTNASQGIQESLKIPEREAIIESLVSIAAGFGSIYNAALNIMSLGRIWSDENLSDSEKMAQTMTILITSLPMLVSGFTNLQKSISFIVGAYEAYTASKIKNTAATVVNTAAHKVDNKAFAERIVLVGIANRLEAGHTTLLLGSGTAAGVAAAATELYNKALIKLKSLQSALGASLINPWTLVIAAIGIGIAGIISYNQHLEETRQKQIDTLTEKLDKAEEQEQEQNKIRDLYNAYQNAYATYQKTGEGKEELKDATLALNEALDGEITQLDLLASSYEELNKKIADNRVANAKKGLDDAKTRRTDALALARTELGLETDYTYGFENNTYRGSPDTFGISRVTGDSRIATFGKEVQELLPENLKEKIKTSSFDFSATSGLMAEEIEGTRFVVEGMGESSETLIAVYDAISKAWNEYISKYNELVAKDTKNDTEIKQMEELKSFIDSTFGQDIQEYVTNYEAVVNKLRESDNNIISATLDLALSQVERASLSQHGGVSLSEIDSQEKYDAFAKAFTEKANAIFDDLFSEENRPEGLDVDKIVNSYLAEIDSTKTYATINQAKKDAEEKFKNIAGELEEAFSGWQEEYSLDLIISVLADVNEYASKEEIDAYLAAAQADLDSKKLTINAEIIASAWQEMEENGTLAGMDDDDRAALEETLATMPGDESGTTKLDEYDSIKYAPSSEQQSFFEKLYADTNYNYDNILGKAIDANEARALAYKTTAETASTAFFNKMEMDPDSNYVPSDATRELWNAALEAVAGGSTDSKDLELAEQANEYKRWKTAENNYNKMVEEGLIDKEGNGLAPAKLVSETNESMLDAAIANSDSVQELAKIAGLFSGSTEIAGALTQEKFFATALPQVMEKELKKLGLTGEGWQQRKEAEGIQEGDIRGELGLLADIKFDSQRDSLKGLLGQIDYEGLAPGEVIAITPELEKLRSILSDVFGIDIPIDSLLNSETLLQIQHAVYGSSEQYTKLFEIFKSPAITSGIEKTSKDFLKNAEMLAEVKTAIKEGTYDQLDEDTRKTFEAYLQNQDQEALSTWKQLLSEGSYQDRLDFISSLFDKEYGGYATQERQKILESLVPDLYYQKYEEVFSLYGDQFKKKTDETWEDFYDRTYDLFDINASHLPDEIKKLYSLIENPVSEDYYFEPFDFEGAAEFLIPPDYIDTAVEQVNTLAELKKFTDAYYGATGFAAGGQYIYQQSRGRVLEKELSGLGISAEEWELLKSQNNISGNDIFAQQQEEGLLFKEKWQRNTSQELNNVFKNYEDGNLKQLIPGSEDFSTIQNSLEALFGQEIDAKILDVETLTLLQEGLNGSASSLLDFFKIISDNSNTSEAFTNYLLLQVNSLDDLSKLRFQHEVIDEKTHAEMAPEVAAKEAQQEFGMGEEDYLSFAESLGQTVYELEDWSEANDEMIISTHELAINVLHFEKNLKGLNDTLDENYDIIKKGDKTSADYIQSISSMQRAVSKLLKVKIPKDFIVKNLDLIKEAAEGNAEALEELRDKAAEEIIMNIDTDGLTDDAKAALNNFNTLVQNTDIPDLKIGATLEEAGLQTAFDALLTSGQFTADQLNAILSSIGFSPEVEEMQVPVDNLSFAEGRGVYTWVNELDGREYTLTTDYKDQNEHNSSVTIPVLNGTPRFTQSTGHALGNKGGGGGGGKKKPKTRKPVESKKDPFHDVNIRIKNLTTDLDRLDKAREKLVGKDLTKNLNEQLEIIKQQVAAEKEKIAIAEREAALKRKELAKEGVKFGEDGQITNYFDIIDEKEKELNRMIDKYNGMSAESQEEFEEKITEAEEAYDKFLETLQEYEELINDTIPESENKIQEAIDKQIEIQVDKFKMAVELRLETSEAEREWNEFKNKVINDLDEDDTIATTRVRLQDYLSYYNTGNTGVGSIQALSEQVQNTIKELNEISATGWSDVYGDNQAQAIEDLKEYTDQLKDQLMEIEDIVDEVNEAYYEVIDEVKEDFDKQIEQYEHVSDLIQHDMEVIKLLYGEDEYGAMASFFERQMENNNAQLDSLRKQAEFWRNQMNNAEAGSEAWDLFRENYEETVSELNDSLEDALDTIVEKYVNSINQIFDELNDKLSNGTGLDYMEEEWDLINKNADEYLDAVNAAYGIHEVEAKFIDAINDTDSVSTQQRLNQLMKEQLDDLRERDKLTEYDVERAERMLDIELKRIALEEAQQNKTKLRLRRDSQGNYSYQYVTDEDAVREAQDELAAAQNELYNFDKDRYKENLDSMYATYQEFQEKMLELYEDQTLSDEERERKKALLIEQYGELINGKTEQNTQIRINLEQSAFDELAALYDRNIEELQNMVDAEKDILMTDLIPAWSSGVQEMIDTFIAEGGFIPACIEAFEKLGQAVDGYKEDIKDVEDVGDMDSGELKNGVDDLIDSTNELITNNDKLLESANQELEAIQSIIAELEKMIAKYQEAKDAAIDAVNAGYNSWGGNKTDSAIAAESDSGTGSGAAASAAGSKNFNLEPEIGDKVKFTSGSYYSSPDADEALGSMGLGEYVEIVRVEEDAAKPYQVAIDNEILGWLDKNQISAFDTGGYTGEWGSDGKLALLHQKELILNASDTANILNAVEVMRDISSMLDASMMNRILGMMSGVGATLGAINRDTDTIEQNVHIEASFPSVTNSNEIQDALNNLVNIAAQRSMSQLR